MSDHDIQFDPDEVEALAQWKSPEHLAAEEFVQHMPDDFIEAYRSRSEARWEPESYDWNGWPLADTDYDDDDSDRWSEVSYYSEYMTTGGRIYELFMVSDRDGNHDSMYEAELGSAEWKRLQRELGVANYYSDMAAYYRWVAEYGEDPLRYLPNVTQRRVDHKWLVGVKLVGGRGKFVAARKILDNPPSPPAVKRLSQVPKEVKDYMNFDKRGYMQDPWAEVEPHMSVSQSNTLGYTHVAHVDFNTQEDVKGSKEKLKELAQQHADKAAQDAAEALKREDAALGESFDPEEVEAIAQQPNADFGGLGFQPSETQAGFWEYQTATPLGFKVRIDAKKLGNGRVNSEIWWLYLEEASWINTTIGQVPVERFNQWFTSVVHEIESGTYDAVIRRSKGEYDQFAERDRRRAAGLPESFDPEEVEAVATSIPPRWELKWEDKFRKVLGIYFEGRRIGDYTIDASHRGGEPVRRMLTNKIAEYEKFRPYEYGAGWVNFWDWYWHVGNRKNAGEEPE